MAKIAKAVFDTSPFLHLHEVNALSVLEIIQEKQIRKEETITLVKKLSSESTLFLTSDLGDWILKEIEEYK